MGKVLAVWFNQVNIYLIEWRNDWPRTSPCLFLPSGPSTHWTIICISPCWWRPSLLPADKTIIFFLCYHNKLCQDTYIIPRQPTNQPTNANHNYILLQFTDLAFCQNDDGFCQYFHNSIQIHWQINSFIY